MRHGNVLLTMLVGVGVTAAAVAGVPIAAHAQVTCTQGTAVMVRAVGPASAPMQIPAQVHVTICSDNGNVVGVIPAFTTVGPANAPMIIPTSTFAKTCAPTVVAATPVSGGGLTSPLQFAQVGSGVATINVIGGGTMTVPVITSSSATIVTVNSAPAVVTSSSTLVTSTPTAFTCF